jgi:hypothetical protein
MIAVVLGWLGNLLGGPFAKAALDAYRAKLAAGNRSERITANLATRELVVEQRERELATPNRGAGTQRCLVRFLLSHLSYMRGKLWSGTRFWALVRLAHSPKTWVSGRRSC